MVIVFAVSMTAFAVSYVVVRWRAGGLHEMTGWYVLASIVFVNTGFLIYAIESGPNRRAGIDTGLVVVSLGLIAFVVGALVSGAATRSARISEGYPVLGASRSDATELRKLLVLATGILVPAWVYFIFLGYVPLFDGVRAIANSGIGGLGELQASRLSRDAYASDSGTRIPLQGFLQIARNVGVPLLAAFAIAQLQYCSKKFPRIVVVLLCVVTVLLAGQRWPLLYLIVAVIVALSLSHRGMKASRLVYSGLALTTIGVFISVMQGRTMQRLDDWGEAIWFGVTNLFSRVFYEQSIVPIWSYERDTFGRAELLGRSYLESLAAWLPGPGTSFPVEFYMRTTGDNNAYTAPPDFYTEAYINFGYVGVVMFSFLWGVLLRQMDIRAFSSDPASNVAFKSGLAAVMVLSCFTGPMFTLSGVLMIIVASTILKVAGSPERAVSSPRGPNSSAVLSSRSSAANT